METNISNEELEQFFLDALQKLYWAEQRRVTLLESLKDNAFSPGLIEVIELQQAQVQDQLDRQRKVFHLIRQEPQELPAEAFAGILQDAETMVLNKKRKTRLRDLSIISSLQKVVHYMMASYAMLIHLCGPLELPDAARLLQPSLDKEHEAEDAIDKLIRR